MHLNKVFMFIKNGTLTSAACQRLVSKEIIQEFIIYSSFIYPFYFSGNLIIISVKYLFIYDDL